jgi:hypothetical protein
MRKMPSELLMALCEGGTSINTWWPTLGSLSWTFDILVSILS